MSKCLKRGDAIKYLKEIQRLYVPKDKRMKQVIDMLSADVVEVVRCKDCKHHEELLNNNDGNVICWVHDIDVIVDRNGYCNYGERKEQEHTCESCCYQDFDKGSYPCSRCICNEPTENMWKPR